MYYFELWLSLEIHFYCYFITLLSSGPVHQEQRVHPAALKIPKKKKISSKSHSEELGEPADGLTCNR